MKRGTSVSRTADRGAQAETGSAPDGPARVAIVGTPRSGNTWLRRLLSDALAAEEIAVHHPAEIPWDRLPNRCVIQIHWLPTRHFRAQLQRARIRTLTTARHPLDVLLSILVFLQRGQDTARWLPGTGTEAQLAHATPYSAAFRSWATSTRAQSLLGITPAWWERADVAKVRYEALLDDTHDALSTVLEDLALQPVRGLDLAINANSAAQLHQVSGGVHVWHARSGLHREVLTEDAREALLQAHGGVATALGYDADASPTACADVLAGLSTWRRLGPRVVRPAEPDTRAGDEAVARLVVARRAG